jgi:hypothetical protein
MSCFLKLSWLRSIPIFRSGKKGFAPAQKDQIALNATAQLELLLTIDDL